ncbi:MAG: protein phosphatase CheZ [Bacteroidetes bacterium]|nr:protein phosphatase CheZ [Bacteroidota bacterium]
MKPDEMNAIVKKVEELRALMVFAQRTMPFLEDVFAFVTEIVPLLDVLRSSVESTSEKLPKASKQLDKVTTATEMASTEILNIVEGMYAKIDRLRAEQDRRHKVIAEAKEAVQRLGKLAGEHRTSGDAHAAGENAMHLLETVIPTAEAAAELESIQSDCTNIMIALQVQDITAQPIAAVNTLMQSVDEGLNRLMRHFSKTTAEHDESKYRHRRLDIVFDVSAEYDGTGDRQKAADDVIEETKRNGIPQPNRPRRKRRH